MQVFAGQGTGPHACKRGPVRGVCAHGLCYSDCDACMLYVLILQYRGQARCASILIKKRKESQTFGRIEDKCGVPSVQVQVTHRDPRRRRPLSGNWMRLLCNPVNVHAERVQVSQSCLQFLKGFFATNRTRGYKLTTSFEDGICRSMLALPSRQGRVSFAFDGCF